MPKKGQLFLFGFIAVIFTLVGCGGNIDRTVTFYRGEAWEADIEFSLPGELVALLGSLAELEADIAESVAEWEAKGANVSWQSRREDTTLIYSFHVEGQGLELLNEIAFENGAVLATEEVDGRPQIYFSYRTSGDLSGASSNIVTLRGGEIVSSNGTQLDSGTVQWVNSTGQLEAVLTERSRFSISTLLITIVLVAGTGGAGWYFWQNRQRPQLQPAPAAFCTNCGAPLNSQAKFCPNCGHQQ